MLILAWSWPHWDFLFFSLTNSESLLLLLRNVVHSRARLVFWLSLLWPSSNSSARCVFSHKVFMIVLTRTKTYWNFLLLFLSDSKTSPLLLWKLIHSRAGFVFRNPLFGPSLNSSSWSISANEIFVFILPRPRTHRDLFFLLLADRKTFFLLFWKLVHSWPWFVFRQSLYWSTSNSNSRRFSSNKLLMFVLAWPKAHWYFLFNPLANCETFSFLLWDVVHTWPGSVFRGTLVRSSSNCRSWCVPTD